MQNRITPYLGGCPEDMLVDACQAFCEEQEERSRHREDALQAIIALEAIGDSQGITETLKEATEALSRLHLKRESDASLS